VAVDRFPLQVILGIDIATALPILPLFFIKIPAASNPIYSGLFRQAFCMGRYACRFRYVENGRALLILIRPH
jgi:hypothetical protein